MLTRYRDVPDWTGQTSVHLGNPRWGGEDRRRWWGCHPAAPPAISPAIPQRLSCRVGWIDLRIQGEPGSQMRRCVGHARWHIDCPSGRGDGRRHHRICWTRRSIPSGRLDRSIGARRDDPSVREPGGRGFVRPLIRRGRRGRPSRRSKGIRRCGRQGRPDPSVHTGRIPRGTRLTRSHRSTILCARW